MKKLFLSVIVLISLSSFVFGQEESDIITGEESIEIPNLNSNDSSFRLGGTINIGSAIGSLNKYAGLHLGGGIQAEYDFGFSLPEYIKLGMCAQIHTSSGFLKDDILLSMWNLQLTPGFYGRFILLDGNIAIQPGLSYGIQLNFLKKNDEYNNKVDSVYLDQLIEFSLGFRFIPQNLLNGSLEFGITPYYIMCPEKQALVQYAGADFSVFYRF